MKRLRWLVACLAIAFAATMLGAGVAGAKEPGGPPTVAQLRSEISEISRTVKLSAVITPNHLKTRWRIYIEDLDRCGPIKEKRPKEPVMIASGTTNTTSEVSGTTAYSEYGARKFRVTARNGKGGAEASSEVDQPECHAE